MGTNLDPLWTVKIWSYPDSKVYRTNIGKLKNLWIPGSQKINLKIRISLPTPNNEMGRKVNKVLNQPTPQKPTQEATTSQMGLDTPDQNETPKPKSRTSRKQPPKKKKKKKRVETSSESDSDFSTSSSSDSSFDDDDY